METFSWHPLQSNYKKEIEQAYTTLEFESGHFQTIKNAVAKATYNLSFVNKREQHLALIQFLQRHDGGQLFLWTPPYEVEQKKVMLASGIVIKPLGKTWIQVDCVFSEGF